tara:strand:+ start:123684 stop:124082 length:399 start_codon:yes stop_codon:yes gene_type:complete
MKSLDDVVDKESGGPLPILPAEQRVANLEGDIRLLKSKIKRLQKRGLYYRHQRNRLILWGLQDRFMRFVISNVVGAEWTELMRGLVMEGEFDKDELKQISMQDIEEQLELKWNEKAGVYKSTRKEEKKKKKA